MIDFVSLFMQTSTTQSWSSFLSLLLTLTYIFTLIGNLFSWVWNLIQGLGWVIIKFILGILEAFEFIVNEFLGIGNTVNDYYMFAKNHDLYDSLAKTFRAISIVAIVLIIVFTIFAIIKQEYQNAFNGMEPNGNDPKPIVINMLKKIVTIAVFPLLMIFVISGVNSILTAFSRAIKGEQNMTVAAQILASSTYDSNKFRLYANENKRIPIIIEAYDATEYGPDQQSQLAYKIKTVDVQSKLLNTATMMSNNNYLSFKESLIYKNNQLANSSMYGDYYESFICTAEQYQVMADFVDYAEKTGMTYYIKALDDENIEWKYVNGMVYEENENTLTINYTDANDITNNNKTSDSYTITYAMSYSMTSPISDALDSILAMLGVGEHSDNLYKVMERDEDSTNIVNWTNEKVLIKLSETFDINKPATWTEADQIIMYEYYRYPANNTFGGVSLETLKTTGVELEAKEILYRTYYAESGAYSPEKSIPVVEINNNYYKVEQSQTLRDGNGNKYYLLKTIVSDSTPGTYFNSEYQTIEKLVATESGAVKKDADGNIVYQNATLKLSTDFDLNDPTSWEYTDQIIVYEYYSNLSTSNMFYANSFEDFRTGVEVPIYTISDYVYVSGTYTKVDEPQNYALINGVYYLINENLELYDSGANFLAEASTSERIYYKFEVDIQDNSNRFGVTTIETYNAETFLYEAEDLDEDAYLDEFNNATNFEIVDLANIADQAEKEKVEKIEAFTLILSKNFDYRNVKSWTYRDYFIFYLYSKYPQIIGTAGLTILQQTGVSGEIGKVTIEDVGEKYVLRVKKDVDEYVFVDIERAMLISEQNMSQTLDAEETIFNNYIDTLTDNLFYTKNSFGESILTQNSTSYRTFKYSENFSIYDVKTWTVLDLILVTLSQKGVIEESSILDEGYNAYIYENWQVVSGVNTLVDTLYKFGKGGNSTTAPDTLFLSEASVLNLKSGNGYAITVNFDAWLNMNATEFIMKKLDSSVAQMISTQDNFVGTLFGKYANNIYLTSGLIDKITEEYVLNGGTQDGAVELFKDLISYTYTRKNADSFDKNDLSTWTQLDFIIYMLTGQIYETFTSQVIIYDGKKYFIIGDYAVQLTGSYEAELTNKSVINSSKLAFNGTTIDDLKAISTFDEYIVNGTDFDAGEFIHYLNESFEYTPQTTVGADGAITDPTKVTAFDVILAKYFDTIETKEFEIFTNNRQVFLQIKSKAQAAAQGGIYLRISSSSTDDFYFNKKIELKLKNETFRFTDSGTTINLFEETENFVTNTSQTLADARFNEIESIVYNITGKSNKQTVKVFKTSNLKNYIVVDGYYIDITGAEATLQKVETATSILDGAEKKLSYLYENYYQSYVKNKVSGFLTGTANNYAIEIPLNFSDNDITSWTPIAVILQHLGFTVSNNITGALKVTQGGQHYLYVSQNNAELDGRLEEYYIAIDEICDIIPASAENDTAQLVTKREVLMQNIFILNKIEVDGIYASMNVEDDFLNFEEYLTENFDIATIKTSYALENLKTPKQALFDIQDPSTWNWLDLVYYYYTRETRTEDKLLLFSAPNGETFIRIEYDTSKYIYIQEKSNFACFDTSEVTTLEGFDSSVNMKPLSIIYYSLTNKTTAASLTKYKFGSDVNDYFYFVQNLYTGEYQGIYGVEENEEVEVDGSNTNSYTYTTKSLSNIANWALLDYIVAYIRGIYEQTTVSFGVTQLGGMNYLFFDGKYIKIEGYSADQVIAELDNATKTVTATVNLLDLIDGSSNDSNVLHPFEVSPAPNELVLESNINSPEMVEVQFSAGFDPSDYTTWKLSDFIIYYMFEQGYFKDTTYGNGVDDVDDSIINFQQLVNQGYAPAYVFYLLASDDLGNVEAKKVYSFTVNSNYESNANYVNYNLFMNYYSRMLVGKVFEPTENTLEITINDNVDDDDKLENPDPTEFFIEVINDVTSKDFVYNNYYYFKTAYDKLSNTNLFNVDSDLIRLIEAGYAKYLYSVNLQLSDAFREEVNGKEVFKMADPDDWTLLDFIIMNEYSKVTKSNVFKDVDISELAFNDNHFILFTNSNETEHVLVINGSYYNLTQWLVDDNTIPEDEKIANQKFVKATEIEAVDTSQNGVVSGKYAMSSIVSAGNTSDYAFKVKKESINYITFKDGNGDLFEFPKSKFLISYNSSLEKEILGETIECKLTFIRTVYENTYQTFTINFSEFGSYTVSPIVREVNWPQKLMNDMQVLYPELNWGTLIATDGWLDTLGEFTSAYSSGEFLTSGNASNTTAAGLVLSEFFLSVAKESEMGFSPYEYTPIFDEEVIKSLMLAMLGEYEYKTLSMQAEIFMEMFNIAFAPVLAEIANNRGIEIVDGNVDNFIMSVYKSYLATLLLSSDIGEYLYKVATRVYAEYTIYESLAAASGDYARYLAYINGETDENGQPVNSFVYSSFYELVVYENTVLGSVSPTFTFNFAKAYRLLNPMTELKDSEIRDLIHNKTEYIAVFDYLYDYYYEHYNAGQKVKDTEDIYCFMFDCYFSIKQTLNDRGTKDLPIYLELYDKYLKGEVERWSMIQGEQTTSGSSFMKDYYKLQIQLNLLKIASFAAITPLLAYDNVTYDFANNEEAENAFKEIEQMVDNIQINSPMKLLELTFENAPKFSQDLKYVRDNVKNLFVWCSNSEKGNNTYWEKLKSYNDKVNGLVSELSTVCKLSVGSITDNGSTKHGQFTDDYYDSSYKKLTLFQQSINGYIETQKKLDKVMKSSITFTLAQFGANYVSDGYVFNIGNRDYTVGVSFSPARLAEYVYGGSFLESFGVPAQFTNPEFEGFISIAKKYNGATGMVQTELGMWKELRKFVSKIADFTGKLYYLTNFNDLSENIGDDIILTSNMKDLSGTSYVTQEYLILEYLIESDISADILDRLIMGDTVKTLGPDGLNIDPTSKVYQLAMSLENQFIIPGNDDEVEAFKRTALKDYIKLVYGTTYNNSHGYYFANNTPSERIHIIFKKVMSYLLVSEESEESYSEEAINLDNITFKELKTLLMKGLVNYKQNPSETDKENTGRYLALFNLVSTQFNYTVEGKTEIYRTLSKDYLTVNYDNDDYVETQYYEDPLVFPIKVTFTEDKSTKDMIIKLAGVQNQPVENLVNLEYKDLYDMNGNYDEANGDTFIICSYDEVLGKYIPVMARNSNINLPDDSQEQLEHDEYMDKYGYRFNTKYYDSSHYYPVVAKGVIDASGRPTAIRMVDNEIEFYRSNVTATSQVDDKALARTTMTTESKTVGYTEYTDVTMQETTKTTAKSKAMFIGDSSISSVVNSDFSVYYLQTQQSYNLDGVDELDGMNVIEQFSVFFKMNMKNYMFLYIGLATLVPILFKSTMNVMRRVLDIGALILLGPWAIAASTLSKPGGKSPIYSQWQNNITRSLLGGFGYIVGFNIYYILITTVTNMTFISEVTVAKIHSIGGMTFITHTMLNTLLMFVFVLTVTGAITQFADLLVGIISCNKVANAFEPGTGDMFAEVKKTVGQAIEMANKVKGIVSGDIVNNLKAAAVETLKNSIPGSAVLGKGVGVLQNAKTNLEARTMQKQAEAHGVAPGVAKQAADNYKKMVNEQREAKQQQQIGKANKFMQQAGISESPIFSATPKIIKPKEKKKGGKAKAKGGSKKKK